MKLKLIHEGHWKLASGVNYLDPKMKRKKKSKFTWPDNSPLMHPEDRDRFLKWGKGE